MERKFTIEGRLPCLNDYLASERIMLRGNGNQFTTKGNAMKKKSQSEIIPQIRRDLGAVNVCCPVVIHYHFFEPNMKRDMDNVASYAMKVTQDSLVIAGVLENDGWKHIQGFTCDFSVDKDRPRIEVTIEEV